MGCFAHLIVIEEGDEHDLEYFNDDFDIDVIIIQIVVINSSFLKLAILIFAVL